METSTEKFIQECIVESLALDHENYQMLATEVEDICKQYSVEFSESLFKERLLFLIDDRKIEPCLYSKPNRKFMPEKLRLEMMMDYWFCLSEQSYN